MLSFVARGWIGVGGEMGSCKVSFGKYCILADRARLLSIQVGSLHFLEGPEAG
jgi:hypothetical protein